MVLLPACAELLPGAGSPDDADASEPDRAPGDWLSPSVDPALLPEVETELGELLRRCSSTRRLAESFCRSGATS